MTTTRHGSGTYGLDRPTLDDVRAALDRVHLGAAPRLWATLQASAGITGGGSAGGAGGDPVDAMIAAMLAADPVTSLIGRALQIRTSSYDHLTAAEAIFRSNA